jgi:biotin carboxylase
VWKAGRPFPDARELEQLGLPLFIKADGVDAVYGGPGAVVRAQTAEEAVEALRKLGSSYSSVLVQGFVPGTRVVANFCIWKGEVVCRSMMVAKHENPHYGGVSTLRSVTWQDDLALDAEKKLRHLGLEGVAMMEYRRDLRTGRFYFIEINARYWLGLHVEIMSGIDIPLIQMDAFFDRCISAPDPCRKATLVRYTIPGDIGYVLSLLKDKTISLKRKTWAVIEFILLCLAPRIKSDFNFPGDRKLYYLAFFRFCWSTLLRRP